MFTKIQFWYVFFSKATWCRLGCAAQFLTWETKVCVIDHYRSSKDFQPLIAFKTLKLDFYWWKTSWNSYNWVAFKSEIYKNVRLYENCHMSVL